MARAIAGEPAPRRTPPRPSRAGEAEEKQSFHALLEGVLDSLYRTAARLTRDPDDAEDLVQDTVLKAWRSFEEFRRNSSFKTWITRILVNLYLDRWRTARRRGERVALEGEEFSLYEALQYRSGRSLSPDVADEVLSRLGVERIRAAIESLPEGERIVVTLADVEGFAYEEVAAVLRIPMGTVKSRLFRGRRELQKRLWEYAREMPPP